VFIAVGTREQDNRMDNLDIFTGRVESILKLQETARICRRHDSRAGSAQMLEFTLQQPRRGARLREIVNARAAAAPRGFGALAQFHAGNGPQNLPRLR